MPVRYESNIIGTNIVTKIHEDRKINVTSRVLTMKNAPLPGSHVFQPIVTIFELIQDIIETYIRAKFYEDWKYKHGIHRSHKTALPNRGHVFKRTRVIFKQC
ncbi:hypothetical protein DPMN_006101 [Dreissena polymorpha]|uniref:Uncharacterized protein n=1 Tax=Dreissena polymorpha TaxID=45954 RepID=A0A9D4MRT4_DREPO|nr:hypothetical protein DPMN_006101 [Dreissena polymorpha]